MTSGSLKRLLFSTVFVSVACLAAEAPLIPPELTNYIRGARKLGLKDSELRLNAIKAGWKPAVVDEAMQAVSTSSSLQDSASAQEGRPDHNVPDQYEIGPGDVVQIIVWKEPDASVVSAVVRADGKLTLPFIKEFEFAGLTPAKAERAITERLKPFINEPDVTVIVREVHSKRIYLVGGVKHEGALDLKYPMTVLQALTEAGGLTDYAKRKKIYILRTENGRQFRLPFNYDVVIRGEQLEQNIWVMPNDTIVVQH